MRAYFLNISEDEKKSIREKQRSIYDGYQTMEPKMAKETPLYMENLALDEKGITVNNEGEVSEYKHTGINKPMKKVCEQCGKELAEGKMCECSEGMKYSMEEIEESINIKSKKGQVYNQINESLDWFRKFNKYL